MIDRRSLVEVGVAMVLSCLLYTSGVAKDVAGVGREILNNRFTMERGLCDLGYKTNSDIRDSRDNSGSGSFSTNSNFQSGSSTTVGVGSSS